MGMKARAEKASRAERVAAYSLRMCLIRAIASIDRPLGADALGGNAMDGLAPDELLVDQLVPPVAGSCSVNCGAAVAS